MSVSSEDNKASYVASGSTTYPIPFYFTDEEHIQLYVDDVLKSLSTHYTITGENDPDGGVLTIVGTPYSASETVVIIRSVPVTQEDSLTEGGPNSARANERRFDKLTMIAQQNKEQLSRAIKFPLTSTVNTQMTGTVVPNGLLMFNDDGTALTCGPDAISYAAGVAADASAASASASAAATSASNASTSASAASTSATAASASATAAAGSATAAAGSAASASGSATAAAASQTAAATSATTATTQATNAGNSATAAATSASNASTSAATATTKASEASVSAAAALVSQNASAASATAAATSAAAAAASASSLTPSMTATQSVGSGGTVTANTDFVQNRKVQGSGGAQSSALTPFGSAVATDAINVRLIGQSDTNTLTIPYSDTNYGCLLNGDAVLKKGSVLNLVFDLTALRWYEISRNF